MRNAAVARQIRLVDATSCVTFKLIVGDLRDGRELFPLYLGEIGLLLTHAELVEVLLELCPNYTTAIGQPAPEVHVPQTSRAGKGIWLPSHVRANDVTL